LIALSSSFETAGLVGVIANSGFEGHLSIAGVVGAQAPSWRGKGGKGEETGGYRVQVSLGIGADAAEGPSWQGKGGKGEE
jgi:hypothetical protein